MDDRAQYIAKLEQDATRLVDEVGVLKQEVLSYRAATGELDKAREALTAFLGHTHELTQQTHKLLATLNEIGSGKMLSELQSIRTTAEDCRRRVKTTAVLLSVGFVAVLALLATLVFGLPK